MDKVYLKVAVVHFFFSMIIRFGWSLALAFFFLFLSVFNEFFFPLFVAFLAFDIIASIIESIKLFFHIRRVKDREYPLAEDKDGEKKLYYDPENPRSIRGRMWEKELREKLNNDSSLEECVAAFEEMCEDIKDELAARQESGEESWEDESDLLFFEVGTFHLTGDGFSISLSRQYPDGEGEYFQLCMEMIFDPNKENYRLFESTNSDRVKGDFFEHVRASKAYAYGMAHHCREVKIFLTQC